MRMGARLYTSFDMERATTMWRGGRALRSTRRKTMRMPI